MFLKKIRFNARLHISAIIDNIVRWINEHETSSFFFCISFILITAIFAVIEASSFREMGSTFATCWFIFCILYTLWMVYFMCGLDKTVEKTIVDNKIAFGVSFFVVALVLYGLFIVCYAPLYIGRIKEGNCIIKSILTCIYFSSITVTTVGYGDVVPQHGLGRVFAAAESISGFFILILLANMLGKISFNKPDFPTNKP